MEIVIVVDKQCERQTGRLFHCIPLHSCFLHYFFKVRLRIGKRMGNAIKLSEYSRLHLVRCLVRESNCKNIPIAPRISYQKLYVSLYIPSTNSLLILFLLFIYWYFHYQSLNISKPSLMPAPSNLSPVTAQNKPAENNLFFIP